MVTSQHQGRRVSSGAVRDALTAGHVTEATELLGYPYFVTAQVEHGDKRGRTLGYPTANLRLGADCGLRHGIYAVRVGVGGMRYDGVASFGRRPMFDTGAVLLEIFLFDFSGDLYGAALDVAFIAWIRPEMNFDSVEDLIRTFIALWRAGGSPGQAVYRLPPGRNVTRQTIARRKKWFAKHDLAPWDDCRCC